MSSSRRKRDLFIIPFSSLKSKRSNQPSQSIASPPPNTVQQSSSPLSPWATASSSTSIPLTHEPPQGSHPIAITGALPPHTQQPNSAISLSQSIADTFSKNLWSKALQKLPEQDRDSLLGLLSPSVGGADSGAGLLDELCILAIKQKAKCDEKGWKFNFNGQQVILRDVAQKIFYWLQKFKEVGDMAINFDPVHAALPWAAFRFLLQATLAETEQMGALLVGLENVLTIVNRCKVYESLSLFNIQAGETGQPLENCKSALQSLYAAILRFLSCAMCLYQKKTGVRAISAFLQPEKVSNFIKEFQKLEQTVDTEVENWERMHGRTWQKKIEDRVLRTDLRVASMWKISSQENQCSLLMWISEIAYEEIHNLTKEGRTPKTGEWLLDHPKYQEWTGSSASMILWLHGIPGAGKSKLTSKVVDDLRNAFLSHPNDEALAYFYCDRNQDHRQEPTSILRSFVRQLSVCQHQNALQPLIVADYEQRRQKGFSSGKLTFEECAKIVLEYVNIYPQTTLVLDALDECDPRTRIHLIKFFDSLLTESSKPVKIFISSRPDGDIKNRFQGGPNVGIQATDNHQDIAKFVKSKIAQNSTWFDTFSPALRDDVVQTLLSKSKGMFQWASLQIDQLLELDLEIDVRARLGKLPEELEDAYDEILEQIRRKRGSQPTIAHRAFKWIMGSADPLHNEELVAAVCQDPENDSLEEPFVTISFVLKACNNLLVVDLSGICRFSHLSVQEYLEQKVFTTSQANTYVGKICLILLNDSKVDHQQAEVRGLIRYANKHWHTHVRRYTKTENDYRLSTLLKQFLGSMDESGPAYRRWHAYCESQRSIKCEDFDLLRPSSSASFAICLFGIFELLSSWWETGLANMEQINHEHMALLQIAALGGNFVVTKVLLSKGADINAKQGGYGTALAAASYRGNTATVELLLSKGADVNAQGGRHGTALAAASHRDHTATVKLLLSKGADVNAQGRHYGTALAAASYWGHTATIELLLSKGADVNAQGGFYGTALAAASYWGHTATVELLLSRGADVNAQGGRYGTALAAASEGGHTATVELLLSKGAKQ